ncbi:MAG: 4Fe-4S dicluster domain-containing protein [Dehalococcoidales bacterium]|nr:4Fe-4S dicluster domain-containing protein [Dehalococcoidales bacterium]
MKRILVKEQFCIGCRLCEVYCRLQRSESGELLRAYKREASLPLSGARVEERGPVAISVRCQNCEEPACVYACLGGALKRDADSGLVVWEEEQCLGCWSCILACPYGAIRKDTRRGKIARCDLCSGEEVPACVAGCPNEALEYIES